MNPDATASAAPTPSLPRLLASLAGPGTGRVHLAILALYCLLLIAVVPHHEQWMDEAQAWLIARDVPAAQALAEVVRYEGTPGLWHALLALPARFGAPFPTINWISATLAAIAVALLLIRSPLPLWIKALAPPGFFLVYQYAVVARNYSLFFLLLFSAATLHRSSTRHPARYAICLALLANSTLHGLLVASGLFALWIADSLRANPPRTRASALRAIVPAATLFLAAAAAAVAQGWPPPDLTGILTMPSRAPHERVALVAGFVSDALTGIPALSALCAIALISWAHVTRNLPLLVILWLPPIAVAATLSLKRWHEGAILLGALCALWIARARPIPPTLLAPARQRLADRLATLALLPCLLLHAYWGIAAIVADLSGPYSGAPAVARFIRQNLPADAKVYASGQHAVAILPWFDRNLFVNYRDGQLPSYWSWSRSNRMAQVPRADEIGRLRPDLVVIGLKFPYQLRPYDRMDLPGYSRVGLFPGTLFWKDDAAPEPDAFYLFRRIDARVTSAAPDDAIP